MRVHLFYMSCICLVVLPACNNPIPEGGSYKTIDLTTKQAGYVHAGHDFDFNILKSVKEEMPEKSWMVSPLSMQFLLGMMLNGADEETADKIFDALGYGKGEIDEVNKYMKLMLNEIHSIDKNTKVSLANALFADNSLPLELLWKRTVRNYYRAYLENLDFSNSSSIKKINRWCSNETDGIIPEVLDETHGDYLLVLLNVLCFNGEWQEKFMESRTVFRFFKLENGSDIYVHMMRMEGKPFWCAEDDYCELVKVPYMNKQFNLVVLLPKDGVEVGELITHLNSRNWDLLNEGGTEIELDLWLPRFEISSSIKMNSILSRVGVPVLQGYTEISKKMTGFKLIKQDTSIKVNEQGTEAAAISTGYFKTSGIPHFKSFHADHPFLYLITEQSTGAILFAGCFTGID